MSEWTERAEAFSRARPERLDDEADNEADALVTAFEEAFKDVGDSGTGDPGWDLKGNDWPLIALVAQALREARAAGLEEAAKAADDYAKRAREAQHPCQEAAVAAEHLAEGFRSLSSLPNPEGAS